MQRVFGVFFLGGFFVLVGCSRPPEIPEIQKPKGVSSPEIALRDSLSPSDFRKIFTALNQKGQLKGLELWLQTTPDNDLSILGKAVDQYLYQEALNPDGLPTLLENRIRQGSFTQLKYGLLNLSQTSFSHLLKSGLRHEATPKLLQKGSFIFDPKWGHNISHYQRFLTSNSFNKQDFIQFLSELKNILEKPDFVKEWLHLCQSLRRSELGPNLFISLQQMEELHGEAVRSDLAQQIHKAVKSSGNSASLVNRLLKLVNLLNRSSAGLFSEAQKTLQTEEGESLIRLLSERFESVILKGAAGFIKETLAEPFDEVELSSKFWADLPRKKAEDAPTENFTHLFRRIQYALDKMSNSSRTYKDPQITLNSFILTRWFEAMAIANLKQIESIDSKTFADSFWKTPIHPFVFNLNLLEIDEKGKPIKDPNGKYTLSQRIENELKALGMEEFANDLKWGVKQDSFGATSTRVEINNFDQSFLSAFRTVVSALHKAHPLADPVPFLSSVAYLFTRPNEKGPLTLADLDSPNMLNSLQNFSRGLSFAQIRKLVSFLFEDLEIGNLSAEDRDKLKMLFPNNSVHAELLDQLLQNLQVIYDLDSHASTALSLLEFYHSLLSNSRLQDISAISKVFSFVEKTDFFGKVGTEEKYPNLLGIFSREQDLSQIMHLMADANSEQQAALVKISDFIVGQTDIEGRDFISFFKDVIVANPTATAEILNLVIQQSEAFALTENEKIWIGQFVSSSSFADLYRILVTQTQSENLHQLINEFEKLQKSGDLEGLIKVLGNMRSDRMQRLALALWSWEKSPELEAFFEVIKTLTKS